MRRVTSMIALLAVAACGGSDSQNGGAAGPPSASTAGSAAPVTSSGMGAVTTVAPVTGTAMTATPAGMTAPANAMPAGGAQGAPAQASSGGAGASAGPSAGSGAGAAPLTGMPMYKTLSPLPTVRQEHAVTTLGGKIYAIGGFLATRDATNTAVAYDPAADSWASIANLPVAAQHVNAAAVDGKIYVAGFFSGAARDVDGRGFVYDPEADAWSPIASQPAGRERATSCVVAHQSKLYLFGGGVGPGYNSVATALAYDVATDAWSELSPMPIPREHCAAVVIGDAIYIGGGRNGGIESPVAVTLAYDPAADSYAERAPIPTPRGGTSGAALGGRFFLFGGEGNMAAASGVFPDAEAFDPGDGTGMGSWETMPEMPIPRHGLGAASLDGRIYLPGGGIRTSYSAVDENAAFFFQ